MRMPLVCLLMLTVSATDAADLPRDPLAVLNSLADQIYVVGETSGKAADMVVRTDSQALEVVSR
jgi:hypothetical protein